MQRSTPGGAGTGAGSGIAGIKQRQQAQREVQERDEADRPFCSGQTHWRIIGVSPMVPPDPPAHAGLITDPAHVIPQAQAEHLQMIGRAYGHAWAHRMPRITMPVAQGAFPGHVTAPERYEAGDSAGDMPPQARAPSGEVWGYGESKYAAERADLVRSACWRVMPDGRLMIWLYNGPLPVPRHAAIAGLCSRS